jgi:DNA primase catalytic subunit
VNWRKRPPGKPGKYWTRLNPEDPSPTIIELVDDGGLRVLQLGRQERPNLAEYLRGQPPTLEFYGRLRIPKTPIPRAPVQEPERDPVRERFEKQTDPKVVMAMVNEYLAALPIETRKKIPKTLRLPTSISSVAELETTYDRFDEASFAWGIENDVDNPALDDISHFLQMAWLQLEEIAMDAELDRELPE